MLSCAICFCKQVWQQHNYGDSLRLYIDPPQFDTFGVLGWWDKNVGNSNRAAVSQWIGANVMLGGSAQLYQRASNIWGERGQSPAAVLSSLYRNLMATSTLAVTANSCC